MSALALDDAPELPEIDGPLLAAPAAPRQRPVNWSTLKALALSGKHYQYAVHNPTEPTPAMKLGTLVHHLVLGPRKGARALVRYEGQRRGAKWEAFEAGNVGAEILTASEWDMGEQIASAVLEHPVARERLAGARTEVPLTWEEDGILFATSGVDIITAAGAIGDLKTCSSAFPEAIQRQAMRMLYPQQLAFYARGARANGIVPSGLFLLCVETRGPFDLVDLELTSEMIAFADRSVSLWLEKLHVYRESSQWPGFCQSPIPFEAPRWLQGGDEEDDADG